MNPYTSWAIFLAIAASVFWKYGLIDKLTGKKPEPGGTNRGRTLSRTTDTKIPDWVESESKTKASTKNTKKQGPRKSVKKAVQEVGNKAEATLSGVSTTGADADDDLSPVQSPSLTDKVANAVPSGKDVSDMLDPKTLPGVLKIGASEKPARAAKPQQQKLDATKQTKKQAQNAKKREAEKAAKAEAELERKKLQEQQLRTARLARGEAPGTRYQSSQPASNAWNNTVAPAPNQHVTLLDTIDATSSASSATNGTAPTPDSTSYSALPSEEDQIAAAMADSAWTEVPKGKKKNKKAEEAVAEVRESAPISVKATPVPAPKKENKKEVKPASRYELLSAPTSEFSDPRDSDWPVV